jgi:hypothetical protein
MHVTPRTVISVWDIVPTWGNLQCRVSVRNAGPGLELRRLERFPDKEEVGGSSPPSPTPGPAEAPQEELVKKLLVVLLAAGAGYVLWRKLSEDAAGRDLWSEVTDSID